MVQISSQKWLVIGIISLLIAGTGGVLALKYKDIKNLFQSNKTEKDGENKEEPKETETTVRVYFSKDPESYDDFTFTVPVIRKTQRPDIEVFSIEKLIEGPNTHEQSLGYFTPVILMGKSTCSEKDFSLHVDKNKKIAILKFCKDIATKGVGDDARIETTIQETLKQFPYIEKVIILTKDDHCFGDASGLDACKT